MRAERSTCGARNVDQEGAGFICANARAEVALGRGALGNWGTTQSLCASSVSSGT